jgi:hypothetical protein
VLVAVARGGLLEQHPRGGAAELLAGLADRRKRHRGGRGEVDVVVADDRDLLGHADLVAGHLLQDAERDQVVGAEHRGGPVRRRQGRDVRACLLPGGHVQRPDVDDVQVAGRAADPLEGAQRALEPVGHLPD